MFRDTRPGYTSEELLKTIGEKMQKSASESLAFYRNNAYCFTLEQCRILLNAIKNNPDKYRPNDGLVSALAERINAAEHERIYQQHVQRNCRR